MNLLVILFAAVSWLGGAVDSDLCRKAITWDTGSSYSGVLHAQADDPESSGAAQGRPIGGNEQNWGSMIVFAVGIGIFLVAYIMFGRTPAPKKKKKKKF